MLKMRAQCDILKYNYIFIEAAKAAQMYRREGSWQ
jgi:hypothetical protein